MRVGVNTFSGLRPICSADLLNPGEAQVSINAKLDSGNLVPYMAPNPVLALTSASPIKTIYRFGLTLDSVTQYWWQFPGDVNVVKGPIDLDTEERTYWTDGVYPKKANAAMATASVPYPTNSYSMGVPAPTGSISASVTGTPTSPTTDPVEVFTYVVTYVTAWGEEGPPNVASASVNWQPGQTINITGLPVAPTGPYNVTGLRLYRSATGSNATQFQLVNKSADIAIGTTGYTDTKTTANLGEVLQTTGFLPPPNDMVGLVSIGNGVLAGFTGSTLCFCEPDYPYAWPVRYQRAFDAPIVGIAPFNQSLLVGTTRGLHVVTGIDPGSMSEEPLSEAQSLASKLSMVNMMGGVLFASPDGLYRVDSSGLSPLTANLISREQWQSYNPSSMRAFEHNNRYIVFYDNGTTQGSLIFTFGSNMSFVTSDQFATAGYRERHGDKLFIVQSNVINEWDTGTTPLTYTWTSGVFHLTTYVNFGVARVDADTYPLTFKFYANDTLQLTQTVTDSYAFRLPSGYRSQRCWFLVTGSGKIREVEIATTANELRLRYPANLKRDGS